MSMLAPLLTLAQGRAVITGTVSSPAGTGIEFATITLHRASDSTVVKTEFSDGLGQFQLSAAWAAAT